MGVVGGVCVHIKHFKETIVKGIGGHTAERVYLTE